MPPKLILVLPTYASDLAAQAVWSTLQTWLADSDAIAFYMHPTLGTGNGVLPDFAVLSRVYGALSVRILRDTTASISVRDSELVAAASGRDTWPLAELDDLQISLQFRFDSDRRLRGKIKVHELLACPLITKSDFVSAVGSSYVPTFSIWRDSSSNTLPASSPFLSDHDWRLAQSAFQSAAVLNKPSSPVPAKPTTLGDTIRVLEQDIALLDEQQTKVALQIVDGPQRVRGLAGTGKTVLLALKAATIHSHYPDASVLFTFNTQSLYNQARDLITRFYRINKQSDPDWTKLLIRHAWGSRRSPGVYSELAARQGTGPLDFQQARSLDPRHPFKACCNEALKHPIIEEFDYVLIDEAQDFPGAFFRVLYKLTKPPKRIYFAFDELQSLSMTDIPTAVDLFGVHPDGRPLVDLEGEYPGGVEKDLVLSRAYRCPADILMLAHGIGLGIHSARGCVQMISHLSTWNSIGYDLEAGKLEVGHDVTLFRPAINSPNRVKDIYGGTQPIVARQEFDTRDAELEWVIAQVALNIQSEGVLPNNIVVISLDSLNAKKYMSQIQRGLQQRGILSVIPGLVDAADEFAEAGRVTLSTIYRAKGNEAPIVYIVSFDSLYDYIQELDMRNRAFTAISRAKGWVRITGTRPRMSEAIREIDQIVKDIPRLRFKFPDMARIERNLDSTETARRRREVKTAESSVRQLASAELGALAAIPADQIAQLEDRLRKLRELQGGTE